MDEKRTWTKVNSSRLDSVDYNPLDRTLFVRFPADKQGNHSVYLYANVEPQKFNDLVNAPSVGKFFNAEIVAKKTDHPYKRLDSEPSQPEEPVTA